MSPIAINGPATASTVSNDWRSPKVAPRRRGGLISAIRASRGAPRMPLPTRSMNRAPATQPTEVANGKIGFAHAARPYPKAEEFSFAEPVAQGAREHPGDGARRFGDTFDDPNREHGRSQSRNKEHRKERMDHLRRDVHEQGYEAQYPHTSGQLPPCGRTFGSFRYAAQANPAHPPKTIELRRNAPSAMRSNLAPSPVKETGDDPTVIQPDHSHSARREPWTCHEEDDTSQSRG